MTTLEGTRAMLNRITQITGPAMSGKTTYLKAIKEAALAKGYEVIGPVDAEGLWALDRRVDRPDRSSTVLLIDEYCVAQMTKSTKDMLADILTQNFHQIFIASMGLRNEWKGLK